MIKNREEQDKIKDKTINAEARLGGAKTHWNSILIKKLTARERVEYLLDEGSLKKLAC
jgi:acetyl-CoA carboxylase carboxyltransferase component